MRKFARVVTLVTLAPIFAGSTFSAIAQQRANQQTVGDVDTTGTVSVPEHRGATLTFQSPSENPEPPVARYENFTRSGNDCYVRYPSGENVPIPRNYCAR